MRIRIYHIVINNGCTRNVDNNGQRNEYAKIVGEKLWRCSISICHFTQKHVSPRFKFLRIFNQLTVMKKSEYWNELIWSCVESNVRNWWMISTCAMCNPPSAGDLFISSVYLSFTNVCMYVYLCWGILIVSKPS